MRFKVVENGSEIRAIRVPSSVDWRFVERGLTIYRLVPKVRAYKAFLSEFVPLLRRLLPVKTAVSRNVIEELCSAVDSVRGADEVSATVKGLLRQMLPETTRKLLLLFRYCPTTKIGREMVRCKQQRNVFWNPELAEFTPPFNLTSILDGRVLPSNNVERTALEMWRSLRQLGQGALPPNAVWAVVRHRDNANALDELVRVGRVERNDNATYSAAPVADALRRLRRAYQKRNCFPAISDWERFLRGKPDLFESCCVLCANEDDRAALKKKVPQLTLARTYGEAVLALQRLTARVKIIVFYKFDVWFLEQLIVYLPLLEDKTVCIKEVLTTRSSEPNGDSPPCVFDVLGE